MVPLSQLFASLFIPFKRYPLVHSPVLWLLLIMNYAGDVSRRATVVPGSGRLGRILRVSLSRTPTCANRHKSLGWFMSPPGIGLQNLSQRDDSCAQVSPRPQAALGRMSNVRCPFGQCPFCPWSEFHGPWSLDRELGGRRLSAATISGVDGSRPTSFLRILSPWVAVFEANRRAARICVGTCVGMCVGLIILAAPLDAFLCDFCRKLISSRHVCTHHHTRCPLFAEGECLCKRSLHRICVSFYMNNGNLRLSDILNCH